MTWFDTTSNQPERLKKCRTIVEEYGYKEIYQFAVITLHLRDIYFALLTGLNNGAARIAMSSIFDIPYLLLTGKSEKAVMNIGGSSSLNIVNGHCIEVLHDLDIFEALNEEVARKILSGEEIEGGVHQQVTPDVVMCKFDQDERVQGCKFYLFGECKCQTKLRSRMLMSQVFKQCLRGLLDYNTVYGCGFTYEGLFLSKLEIKSDLNEVIIAKELFYFQDAFKFDDQFNCKTFLDFMLCLSQIVKLNGFEY